MTQKSVEITRKGAQHSFSHPDCDRRYRNFTDSVPGKGSRGLSSPDRAAKAACGL